ncbi:transposase [Streptomyces sp. NBRC 110611]|nr:transposase [Streptomyces sp. NBRC 110611]
MDKHTKPPVHTVDLDRQPVHQQLHHYAQPNHPHPAPLHAGKLTVWETREAAWADVFRYIEVEYNRS